MVRNRRKMSRLRLAIRFKTKAGQRKHIAKFLIYLKELELFT